MPASLPLIRGTAEFADCVNCPFSKDGQPSKPVYSESPSDPLWMVVGEGPGTNETMTGHPFVGASGQVVNQILGKIGRPREELWVGNATLCMPFRGATEADKEKAAVSCKPRLTAELARHPGKPILTLGAIAARSIIPKPILDAIDPPESAKTTRKNQKKRQNPGAKAEAQKRKSIEKIAERRLSKMIKHHRAELVKLAKAQGKRPDDRYLATEVARVQGQLSIKARVDAVKEYDLRLKERALRRLVAASKPKKPKKPKQVKITDICGTLFDIDVDGSGIRPLIPGIHPAALLRGGGASIAGSHTPDMAFVNLVYDASKVDSLARGKDIRLKINIQHELFDQAKAIELFMQIVHASLVHDACAIDLETFVEDSDRHDARMAYKALIRVIGIGTRNATGELTAVSIGWDLLPSWCHSVLQLLIANTEVTYHNGLYDRTVFRAYGFEMGPRWFDSLLAHHASFPGNAHRLQSVTSQFYGVGPWKSEFRNADETPEALAIYNAKDTGGTFALREPLALHIKRTKTERVYEIDKKMSDMASRMHLAGMPVDCEINHDLMATFSKGLSDARQQVEDVARDPKLREQIWHHLAIVQAGKKRKLDPSDFEQRYQVRLSAMKLDPDWKWKIESGKHIAALLQAMGVQLYQRTEKGEISTKKDVLEELVGVPIVRDILAYRENSKLYSTFVYPIFDHVDQSGTIISYGFADHESRIHPIWNVHRISGRWASQWPVVSNVPKDKWKKILGDALLMLLGLKIPEAGVFTLPDGVLARVNPKDKSISKLVRPNLRRQVKVQRKGRKIVGFDYKQIEARVIALLSGDPFLCEVFADTSRDIHIECARMIFAAFDSHDKDGQYKLREGVKPIEYGFFYLAQIDTLHRQLLKEGFQIEKKDLAVAIAKLSNLMQGVVKWQRTAVAKVSQPPYEFRESILGRRRVWPMGQVEATEAINAGPQFTASAIMNTGMALFMDRSLPSFKEVDPLAQVHDAAYFEAWEDDVDRLVMALRSDFPQEYTVDGRTVRFDIDVKVGDSWDQV